MYAGTLCLLVHSTAQQIFSFFPRRYSNEAFSGRRGRRRAEIVDPSLRGREVEEEEGKWGGMGWRDPTHVVCRKRELGQAGGAAQT